MDRNRLLLAFVLMLMVAIAPSLIWPPKKPTAGRLSGSADSAVVRDSTARPAVPSQPTAQPPDGPTADTGRIVSVTSPLYRLGFSTRGGLLRSAELLQYQSFAPGDSARPVQLVPKGDAFLRHRLVLPSGDTVSLDDWDFRPSPDAPGLVVQVGQAATPLRFDAERRGSHVTLEYSLVPDEYRFEVHGSVTGLGSGGAVLLIDLASGLRSVEKDSLDDYRHYSVVTKASKTERTDFSSIRPDQRALLNGPFEWVGVKSKYFLTAALALEEGQPTFGGAIAIGGPRNGKAASRATVLITMPVPAAGTFRYSVYAGPLDYRQLGRMGHGLDDANPYGGIFRPIVRPVSVFVTSILLWMHGQLHLAYGWALILFGIVVRLLLWPLNQKAMESGIRMQAALAGAARAVLRLREHDRFPGRAVPLASRSVAPRSVQDHSHLAGFVDVRVVQGRADRGAAESADQDDGVLHADLHDGTVPELRVGAEPLLRRAEHLQHPAAVLDREAPAARSAGGRGAAHTSQDLDCFLTPSSRSRRRRVAAHLP
ncbi:MAG: hypothetical protein AUI09_05800 [Gemmatimonadetes bacterium 13_2_20CM_2_66_5]|nr:MAG: hypothetical protein AUI09_05800 [Gemmatimonadetes bacterium 13_2_20CM_2_66_5]